MSTKSISAGDLLYCDPFPDWKNAIGVSAHFVLVLKTWPNGNLMLAPITTKSDRCQISIHLNPKIFSSLYKTNALTDEKSHLSLRDDHGNTTIYIWSTTKKHLTPSNIPPITIDRRAKLSPVEVIQIVEKLPETLKRIIYQR